MDAEIINFRTPCSKVDITLTFCRWGGIPRYVLQKLTRTQQDLLGKAIDSSSMRMLKESLGGEMPQPSVSHRLMHIRAGPDFSFTWVEFASPYVAEKVFAKLWRTEQEKLKTFLAASADSEELGALRGILWEQFVHFD
jgi:hypothetical protein